MTSDVLELISNQFKSFRHQSFGNKGTSDREMSCKKMSKLKLELKNKKPLFIAVFLFAMILGAVVAQLLSNRIDQAIVIRGEDESYLLTAESTISSTEWVGTAVTTTIKVEQIRPAGGTMNIQIENLDNTSFLISNVLLEIGYRDASNSVYASIIAMSTTQVNGSIVGFSEPVWFNTAETTSYYQLRITWYTSAPGGNYQVSVFVD